MAASFFEPEGDRWHATELTRGPWDPGAQHAGPPAALLARELERVSGGLIGGEGGSPGQIGRITFEILRPVPIGPVGVSATVKRPGRSVEMLEAMLTGADGAPLVRATAWRLRRQEVGLASPQAGEPPPGPEAGEPGRFFHTGHDVGYHTAMDYRFVSGAFMDAGPAVVWMRMQVPLVPDEEPTPLQRVLAAADSGNGVSSALPWREWLFINVDLSVHLHRMPEGEWVCLDAVSIPEPNGIGLTDTALHDERGPVGRAMQTLLIAKRGQAP